MNLGDLMEAVKFTTCFMHTGYTVLRKKALEDAEADMSVVWRKPLG
jgi:hypothetical protein